MPRTSVHHDHDDDARMTPVWVMLGSMAACFAVMAASIVWALSGTTGLA
jgi:hypothetical protein